MQISALLIASGAAVGLLTGCSQPPAANTAGTTGGATETSSRSTAESTGEESTATTTGGIDSSGTSGTSSAASTSGSTGEFDATSGVASSSSTTGPEAILPPDPIIVMGDRYRFVGNSFAGNYGGLDNYFVAAVASGLPGTVIETEHGTWFFGQPLSGMTTAIDEIESDGDFDTCVFTSGTLNSMRTFAAALAPLCTNVVLYMTWESQTPSLSGDSYTDDIGRICRRARRLEEDFPEVRVVPAGLVLHDLSIDPPVAPPRADYVYVLDNIHQNGLGTLINSYSMFAALAVQSPEGIDYDPVAAAGVDFVEGTSVGLGPEADPFVESSVTFDAALRGAIQQQVWATVQAWHSHTTQFD